MVVPFTSRVATTINELIREINSFVKKKIQDSLKKRFSKESLEILQCFDALDDSNSNYFDIEKLNQIADQFEDCLNISKAILAVEAQRAKEDNQLGLPICTKRSKNLNMIMQIKNTVATTTATAESVFSAMNRICTNLRASTSADRLENLVIIAMNKDMVPSIDVNVH